jgi:hypothetical protein
LAALAGAAAALATSGALPASAALPPSQYVVPVRRRARCRHGGAVINAVAGSSGSPAEFLDGYRAGPLVPFIAAVIGVAATVFPSCSTTATNAWRHGFEFRWGCSPSCPR